MPSRVVHWVAACCGVCLCRGGRTRVGGARWMGTESLGTGKGRRATTRRLYAGFAYGIRTVIGLRYPGRSVDIRAAMEGAGQGTGMPQAVRASAAGAPLGHQGASGPNTPPLYRRPCPPHRPQPHSGQSLRQQRLGVIWPEPCRATVETGCTKLGLKVRCGWGLRGASVGEERLGVPYHGPGRRLWACRTSIRVPGTCWRRRCTGILRCRT